MPRPLYLVPIIALLLVFAAACGESEPPDFGDDLPADAPRIDQDNIRFKPTELTVDAGTTVYFTNSETARHTVDIDGDDKSGDMRRGDVFAWTFEEPGEYDITCKYHAQMRATITVE